MSYSSFVSQTDMAPKPSPTSFVTLGRVKLMNDMSSVLAGVSLFLCMIVLGFIFMIWSNKDARKCLDRLSFRLIVWSLLSNCIYCIGYIICVQVGPGFWCVAGVWLIQFWLGITNWIITFIALNLQLVLVHGINGLQLEKWYLFATVFINLAITLPPLIKKKFGWDPDIKVCWLTDADNTDRLRWQISTQLAWILLTIFITTVTSLITISHLYKHKFTSVRILRHSHNHSSQRTEDSVDNVSLTGHRDSVASAYRGASRNLMSNEEFRKIILRISLYPIVMIVLNLIITIADIRISTASGIYTQRDYIVYVIYYALYGGRGLFYAMIAILDPALMRGYRVWRGGREMSSDTGSRLEISDNGLEMAMSPNHDADALGLAGISVQTEIESYVQEGKKKYHFSEEEPVSPGAYDGPKTIIESSSIPNRPPIAMKRSSNGDLRNGQDSRTLHWNDTSDMDLSYVDDHDTDDHSISKLSPKLEMIDVEAYERHGVNGIRQRQILRLAKRKAAEKEVKRNI